MNTGEHNTEQEDNYWAQRVQDKKDGELQERARWVAEIGEMIERIDTATECHELSREDEIVLLAEKAILQKLLTRMEAPA